MAPNEHDGDYNFEIGDIVRESVLIIPPGREPWTGIVVYLDKDFYELHSFLGQTESLIAVHWFKAGYVETLPASVLKMVQKAKEKNK